jgi:hypothetical protein
MNMIRYNYFSIQWIRYVSILLPGERFDALSKYFLACVSLCLFSGTAILNALSRKSTQKNLLPFLNRMTVFCLGKSLARQIIHSVVPTFHSIQILTFLRLACSKVTFLSLGLFTLVFENVFKQIADY